MDNITILIKTFERPRSLRRLLKSIFFYYPGVKVIIADDSEDPEKNRRSVMKRWPGKNIKYLILPHDVGPSEGRNRAWQKITTKYFVVCDDDCIFDHRANLPLMRKNLEEYGVDLVCGAAFEYRKKRNLGMLYMLFENILGWLYDAGLHFSFSYPRIYCGKFKHDPVRKKLQVIKYDLTKSGKIFEADLAPGFCLAKTSIRDRVMWRSELKFAEHPIFFWDLKKAGFKVLLNTEVGLNHFRVMPLNYRRRRQNEKFLDENRLLGMKIMNIEIFENEADRRIYKYKNGYFTKEKMKKITLKHNPPRYVNI